MFYLLVATGLLAFLTSYLIVNRLRARQLTELQKEEFKSRIGLKSHYRKSSDKQLMPWWCLLGRAMGPKSSKELEINRQLLVKAGYRLDVHLGGYFLIKFMLIIVMILIGLALWTWLNLSPIYSILLFIVGVLGPEKVLVFLGNRRVNKINLALPDFLDMANICMNAGLSYLEAIKRVSLELQEIYPEICFEFQFLIEQIKIGVPRQEALRQFAKRNDTKDINEFIQVLIQNEKLGAPIGLAINEFSRRMYQGREQLMEEKAAKTSAKMAIIIVPFLMLPYFILMLGEKIVMLGRMW